MFSNLVTGLRRAALLVGAWERPRQAAMPAVELSENTSEAQPAGTPNQLQPLRLSLVAGPRTVDTRIAFVVPMPSRQAFLPKSATHRNALNPDDDLHEASRETDASKSSRWSFGLAGSSLIDTNLVPLPSAR